MMNNNNTLPRIEIRGIKVARVDYYAVCYRIDWLIHIGIAVSPIPVLTEVVGYAEALNILPPVAALIWT